MIQKRQGVDQGVSIGDASVRINGVAGIALDGSSSFSEVKRNNNRDSEAYGTVQSLSSILNNPHAGKSGLYSFDTSWGSWIFSSPADVQDSMSAIPLTPIPEVSRTDFKNYIETVSDSYNKYADVRGHSNWERVIQENEAAVTDNVDGQGIIQGEGLVACLREIPSLYFNEDFALEDGTTFQAACPYSTIPQNMMLQEKLSHYLDIIDVHLVKEISARSDSFYEAQGQIEDLNSKILGACSQIHGLKEVVRLCEGHVVESAQKIQRLRQQQGTLILLHQKLKLMSYVNQAIGDLPLLIAAADCGGALDVIDVLQNLLENGDLVGLHSFRQLGSRLASFMESVNSMLAADFVRVAIHDNKDLETSVIIEKFKRRDFLYIMNVKDNFLIEDNKRREDEEMGLRDQLLPLVIGLLRTSKLPEILRVYRDTLITDIKAAIKVVVAELLSIMSTKPLDLDIQSGDRQIDMESGTGSLASKLRSLSAENFAQLLTAVFDVIQVRLIRAAQVRKIVEQIIEGLQGSYAEAAVAAAFASGAVAAAAAEVAQEDQIFPVLAEKNNPTTVSRNFRADVLRENTEAVCSACNAAHERWSKLLGVRSMIHPKLRLQEFVTIHHISQVFMLATEKIGGRYAPSIRGTLHSQSKAFVDVQHSLRMSKLAAVLEQETWVSVDAPDEFQAIVDKLTFHEELNDGNIPSEEVVGIVKDVKPEVFNVMSPENISEANSSSSPQRLLRHDSLIVSKSTAEKIGSDEQGLQRTVSLDVVAHTKENGADVELKKSQTTPQNESSKDPLHQYKKGREKSSVKTLQIHGVCFHMVNSGLILLKMISEYVDISSALPGLAAEVLHRAAEILKLFNARICQLVLGAGAMQVSGLKSISAKHLGLASQNISFFLVLIADLKFILGAYLPDSRKALLFTEIDRVSQDYKVHKDEIHLKLVQIMKERLLAHIRTLPQVAETWNRSDEYDGQASQFARGLTKEVGVLHRVLSPLLLEADLLFIFTRVVALFHIQLSEAFSRLDLSTPTAKKRLYNDIHHILACIHGLPSDAADSDGVQKPGELDEFLQQRFDG